MPSKVEEVRLSIERVLLGVYKASFLTSKSSGFVFSGAGDGGTDDSAEAGVTSKIRRGIGRRICSAISNM